VNISNQTVAAAFANFLSAGGSQTDAFAIFPDGRRAEARWQYVVPARLCTLCFRRRFALARRAGAAAFVLATDDWLACRVEARSVFGYQRNCWPAIRSSELMAKVPASPSSFAKAMEDGRLPTSLKLRWTSRRTPSCARNLQASVPREDNGSNRIQSAKSGGRQMRGRNRF
jgi:hypothetical protein